MNVRRTSAVRLLAGSAAGSLAFAAVMVVPLGGSASAAPAAPSAAAVSAASAPSARPGRTTRVKTQLELRRAVALSNQRKGVQQIDLARSISLSKGNGKGPGALTLDIDVLDKVVINGNGKTINGRDIDRIFDVASGAQLVLNDVTLRNASPAVAGESGGAIRVTRSLARLTDVTISGSEAVEGDLASGGAIMNDASRVVLVNSTLVGNTARRAGGGIEANGGTTVIKNSDLLRNATGPTPGNGGALHLTGAGTVQVNDSRVADNTATSEGGGLWNSATGTMTVNGSTVVRNAAGGAEATNGGGGIYNDGGDLRLTGGTLRNNDATGAAGSGGGVLNVGGDLDATNVVIAFNTAARAGGGIEATAGSTNDLTGTDLLSNRAGAAPGNGGGLHLTGAGSVDVVQAEVRDNTASAEGGGLWNSGAGTMSVRESIVTGNTAAGAEATQGGGGLFQEARAEGAPATAGVLTVTGTTISGNKATGAAGSGGGILNDQGTVNVTDSTLGTNTAVRAGGGIETNVGTVSLTRVNLTGNTAGAAPGNGGGFHTTGAGTVTYAVGTVTGNSAANQGGGLWNSAPGTMTVTGVTINSNTAPTAPNAYQDGVGVGFTIDGQIVPPGDNQASYPPAP